MVESVTVNAGTSLLATQTSERGVVIGAGQVDNLPLNGRNFTQLISLEPGVVVGGQINGAITFNGLPYQGTTINVDGTDAANPDRPTTSNFGGQNRMNIVSQDFIQEFKTSQGVFSAETGRASAGSINVITKSGTNQFHGSVFEFLRNDKVDARTFFAAKKDKLRLNQFGGTLGGPIVRDKLFFFGGWEGAREIRGTQITGTVPTDSFRSQMLAANPAYAAILNLTPHVTEPMPRDGKRLLSGAEDQTVRLGVMVDIIGCFSAAAARHELRNDDRFAGKISSQKWNRRLRAQSAGAARLATLDEHDGPALKIRRRLRKQRCPSAQYS